MSGRRTVWEQLEETPCTWIVAIAYGSLAVLTDLVAPTTRSLVEHGAAVGLLLADEPWRLLSYAFLHGGLLHLGFNTYFLVLVGPQLERAIGSPRFALLYVVGSIGGAVVGTAFGSPVTPLVGGSGALFGMMGALVALMMRRGRTQLDFLSYHPARSLLTLIAANLLLGWMLPMVSNSAHIGGLVSGFVLVYVFLERGRQSVDTIGRLGQGAWVALLVAAVLWATAPVPRWDWQLRAWSRAPVGSDARRAHESWLRAHGLPPRALLNELESELPRTWGPTGERALQSLKGP